MRGLLLLIAALRLAAGTGGGPCPNVTVEDLLADPAVDEAITTAWADTAEGSDHEKEQGGFIFTCEVTEADGSNEWTTLTESWPADEATDHSIPRPPLDQPAGCTLVGWYHTHPGVDGEPVAGKPGWKYFHSQPSEADLAVSQELGVPGLAVWGHGAEQNVSGFGPSAPLSGCGPGGAVEGDSSGDPHLRTFDGLSYDLQTTGEHVLVRSDDGSMEIQTRQEPVGGSDLLSGNTAVAMRVDGSVVELAGADIVLDGRRREMDAREDLSLPGGGRVTGSPGTITVTWADGSSLQFLGRSVLVSPAEARRGRVAGLLGDFDGDVTDDLVADGRSLYQDRALSRSEVYDVLAPAWRVNAETSLFTYDDGDGPDDFVVEGFPSAFITVDHLEPGVRQAAEQECRRLGVEDPTRLASCVLDVAVSGDDTWATEAAKVVEAIEAMEPVADPDLVAAAGRGDLTQVQELLAAGASVDGRDDQGRTALHWGVVAGDAEVVTALLAAGADVGITDDAGRTALHNAAFWGFEDIARALVSAGASTSVEDDSGQTPADLARQQGHPSLAEELS